MHGGRGMRKALALALALLMASVGAVLAAPAKKKSPFSSADDILRWINGYRSKPEPQKLPVAVHAMSNLNLFRDLDSAGVYVGFIAGVLEANPKLAEGLVTKMFPLPPEDQVALVRAIAYSNLPGWKELLAKFAERMPARQTLIDRFINDKLPTLRQLAMDNGATTLDILWGNYFATGSYEPVLRMVSVLSWAKDADSVERLTVGNMTKLTLATNASRDKELLDMLKASMAHETTATRVVLREVIDAAETFEFGRVRKDAVAAIDTLKVKGPESKRNYQWWGQAGQTALAVGCVVAGALGHVEVGVPCIVGGAVSGAALKYLGPQ